MASSSAAEEVSPPPAPVAPRQRCEHGRQKNKWCKQCAINAWERTRKNQRLLRPPPTILKSARQTSALYIMENSRIPGEVKIGCSNDVPKRKKELECTHNFRMNVLAIFPGKGYLEREVHLQLSHLRVAECAGTEWFKCSLGKAVAVINQVMRRA